MTSLVIKGADFSGAPLAGYAPPVAGASLAAFVGDPNEQLVLKNFGSGADLRAANNIPGYAGGGFRSFTNVNHFISDSFYTSECTLMAVVKGQNTDWFAALSSERVLSGSNRRGLTLRKKRPENLVTMIASGDDGVARQSDLVVPSLITPKCLIGTAAPSGTGGTTVQIHDMTLGQTGPAIGGTNPSTRPMPNESNFPFLVSANYVGTAVQCDIAFVAVWPRVLSQAERATMYRSVAKRMEALGTII